MVQIAERVEGNNTILTLSGRLNIQARKPFQMAINNARNSGVHNLTVNLSQVMFIDSSAIGMLILAHHALEQSHTKLSLIVPPGPVLDTLHLMNIGDLIPIRTAECATISSAPIHK